MFFIATAIGNSAFYNISQRNFGLLLILWCSFKLWWHFCLDQNLVYILRKWSIDKEARRARRCNNRVLMVSLVLWKIFSYFANLMYWLWSWTTYVVNMHFESKTGL
jgi:hypothetical protein